MKSAVNFLKFDIKHMKLFSEWSEVLTKCHIVLEQSYQKLDHCVLKTHIAGTSFIYIYFKKNLFRLLQSMFTIMMHSIIGLTLLQHLSSVLILHVNSSLKQHLNHSINTSLMLPLQLQLNGPILSSMQYLFSVPFLFQMSLNDRNVLVTCERSL